MSDRIDFLYNLSVFGFFVMLAHAFIGIVFFKEYLIREPIIGVALFEMGVILFVIVMSSVKIIVYVNKNRRCLP